jgi:hypothetical protein
MLMDIVFAGGLNDFFSFFVPCIIGFILYSYNPPTRLSNCELCPENTNSNVLSFTFCTVPVVSSFHLHLCDVSPMLIVFLPC